MFEELVFYLLMQSKVKYNFGIFNKDNNSKY